MRLLDHPIDTVTDWIKHFAECLFAPQLQWVFNNLSVLECYGKSHRSTGVGGASPFLSQSLARSTRAVECLYRIVWNTMTLSYPCQPTDVCQLTDMDPLDCVKFKYTARVSHVPACPAPRPHRLPLPPVMGRVVPFNLRAHMLPLRVARAVGHHNRLCVNGG